MSIIYINIIWKKIKGPLDPNDENFKVHYYFVSDE